MVVETMVLEKETPNKFRYASTLGAHSCFGKIYVWKNAFGGRKPKSIQITAQELM